MSAQADRVALVEVQAGLGQILLALSPLATLLLAVAERQERWRLSAVAGALVALAGVAVLARAPAADVPVLSILAAAGTAVCFGQAAVVVRRFPPVHPVTMNAVGMAAGALLLAVATALAGETVELPDRGETWAAVAFVVAVGSVAVFLLYLVLLKHWAASRAAYVFVLIPFVTVALSAWLDDEPVDVTLAIGGLLVLAGVYVGALRAPTMLRDP